MTTAAPTTAGATEFRGLSPLEFSASTSAATLVDENSAFSPSTDIKGLQTSTVGLEEEEVVGMDEVVEAYGKTPPNLRIMIPEPVPGLEYGTPEVVPGQEAQGQGGKANPALKVVIPQPHPSRFL